ncbi:hypothetical protein ACWEN6_37710 [Sphaerisporangium sp. NPDC004334]
MHDAGDLPDHDGSDAVAMEGFQQGERVEPEGSVRADRADVVVGVLVPQAGARPVQSRFTGASGGGAESFQRFVDHLAHATPGRAHGAREWFRRSPAKRKCHVGSRRSRLDPTFVIG